MQSDVTVFQSNWPRPHSVVPHGACATFSLSLHSECLGDDLLHLPRVLTVPAVALLGEFQTQWTGGGIYSGTEGPRGAYVLYRQV